MKLRDLILQKGYLRSQVSQVLASFYKPAKGQSGRGYAAYGSEFMDDEVRMVDQPMTRTVSTIPMGDFAQLGQIPYLLVPYGEVETAKAKKKKAEKKYGFLNSKILVANPVHEDSERAIALEVPLPWNQFKLYALSQNIETN